MGISRVPELQFLFRMVRLGTICGAILVLSCFHACGGDVWALVREQYSSCIFIAFSGFGCRSKHPMRSWDLIHVPNGVVRCGFGLLSVGFVRV